MKSHLYKYRKLLTNLSIKMLMNGPIRQENYLFGFDHLNRKQFNHLYEKYQQVKHNEWCTIQNLQTKISLIILIFFSIRSLYIMITINNDHDDNDTEQPIICTILGSIFNLANASRYHCETIVFLISTLSISEWLILYSTKKFNFFFKLNTIYWTQIYDPYDQQQQQQQIIDHHQSSNDNHSNNRLNRSKIQMIGIKELKKIKKLQLRIRLFFNYYLYSISAITIIVFITSQTILITSDPLKNNYHLFNYSKFYYTIYTLIISLLWSIWSYYCVCITNGMLSSFPIAATILKYKIMITIDRYNQYQQMIMIDLENSIRLFRMNEESIVLKYLYHINELINEIWFQNQFWSRHIVIVHIFLVIIIGKCLFVIFLTKAMLFLRIFFGMVLIVALFGQMMCLQPASTVYNQIQRFQQIQSIFVQPKFHLSNVGFTLIDGIIIRSIMIEVAIYRMMWMFFLIVQNLR
ncbi:hypothetical protein DERP_010216 [Dermatophagoides pteronyssinus]|uniref:Odorant receptor n=1 Tax=Dermatophagoides pteronyssinus TaxID=6956 RepID=A0ABQ8J725_DERPT|nr:hypothetical protein DERP_010216 [Dermatophagoides pteronyssinus]